MGKIPEPIHAILCQEGVSAQCWKRLKDAWPEAPEQEIADARQAVEAARKTLDRFKEAQEVRVFEIRTLPEECVTLEDAEKSLIVNATKDALGAKDILGAAAQLGIGKTTLYRKLKRYHLSPIADNKAISNSMLLKERIARLRAEADRLEGLLPKETEQVGSNGLIAKEPVA